MTDYVGNPLQTRGAEHYTLHGLKGEGMNFLYVRNGLGLEIWLSLDRAGDPSRVIFKGDNMGYFAPCGYVSPHYYDCNGIGFLKSFTAGFFTTCGLTAVGSPCTDEGEELPLHGTISNTPALLCGIDETKEGLTIKLRISDESLFGRKLVMERIYTVSYRENRFDVKDIVTNKGDNISPYMIMYHCNMGYPLLNENSIVMIPNNGIIPRNEHAAKYTESSLITEKPQANFEECCYYYDVIDNNANAKVGIYNPDIEKGLVIQYNKNKLPCFTEWKLMGKRDYVLGLEPGNCTPDGRDVLRKNGTLKFLDVSESRETKIEFCFVNDKDIFKGAF